MKIQIPILFVIILSGCFFRNRDAVFNLVLVNNTSTKFSNIEILRENLKVTRNDSAQFTRLHIDIPSTELGNEGAFGVYVMMENGHRFINMQWAEFFMGHLGKTRDTIYFFDHGYSYQNPIKKPDEFHIFFADKTTSGFDSFCVAGFIKDYKTDKSHNLKVNYGMLEKDPFIKFYKNGNVRTIPIDIDWNDWNIDQKVIDVYDDRFEKPIGW